MDAKRHVKLSMHGSLYTYVAYFAMSIMYTMSTIFPFDERSIYNEVFSSAMSTVSGSKILQNHHGYAFTVTPISRLVFYILFSNGDKDLEHYVSKL